MIRGYKVAYSGETPVIITLDIPDDGLNNLNRPVVEKEYAKYRCKSVFVVGIEDRAGNAYESATSFTNRYLPKLTYTKDRWVSTEYRVGLQACGEGVHFFLNKQCAELYLDIFINTHKEDGYYELRNDDGRKVREFTLKEGREIGVSKAWHDNGQLAFLISEDGTNEFWGEDGKRVCHRVRCSEKCCVNV